MKINKILSMFISITLCLSSTAYAKQCATVNWKVGKVISVNSAVGMGTRIQLPLPLLTDVMNSNNDLWDMSGATNYIVVKPNSGEEIPEGKKAMMYAFLSNGLAIDFELTRVDAKNNIPCLIILEDSKDKKTLEDINKYSLKNSNKDDVAMAYAQNIALQKQITEIKQQSRENIAKSVSDALSRYRYHIYTRYDWTENKSNDFIGSQLISDVYDDGRFTYIRLSNNNKGLLSIEATVGGQNAIIPFKYNDSYAIYQISGIYPNFTMKLDNSKIEIIRKDNRTKGAY